MGHKHGPLLFWQFGKSQLKLFQHFTSQVRRFWPRVRGRQKIFDAQQFPVLVRNGRVTEVLRLLLAEKIRDAIPRHLKQPSRDVLDGHEQAIRFHQFVEDFLQQVLGIRVVGYAPADEIAQPCPLLRNDFGDSTILLGNESDTRRLIHPLMKTDDRREYCRETWWSEPLRHSTLGHSPEFRSGENWVMLMLSL